MHEQEFADNFTKSLKEAKENVTNLKSEQLVITESQIVDNEEHFDKAVD